MTECSQSRLTLGIGGVDLSASVQQLVHDLLCTSRRLATLARFLHDGQWFDALATINGVHPDKSLASKSIEFALPISSKDWTM
jgi:hypothetical protein